jgi:hypothetical protein
MIETSLREYMGNKCLLGAKRDISQKNDNLAKGINSFYFELFYILILTKFSLFFINKLDRFKNI